MAEPATGYAFVPAAVDTAHSTVQLAVYELQDGAVEAALVRAAGRGVRVSVLLDQRLERGHNTQAYTYLSGHGVQVAWGDPGTTFHEKVLCVDGLTCWVMTGNLTPRYYGEDRDFVIADHQPADVAAISSAVRADTSGGRPAPASTAVDLLWSPGSEQAVIALIGSARSRLLVEHEELASSSVLSALEAAARRGVDIELVMTDQSSWHRAFEQLRAAGVHVATYPDRSNGLYIHAKALVVDGQAVLVGSQNFSTASLDHNRELGIVTRDRSVVSGVEATITSDFAGAVPYTG